jgi:hypothetical protein
MVNLMIRSRTIDGTTWRARPAFFWRNILQPYEIGCISEGPDTTSGQSNKRNFVYAISPLLAKAINTNPHIRSRFNTPSYSPEMTYRTFLILILVSVTLGAPKAHEKRVTSSETPRKLPCTRSTICVHAENDCGESSEG